MSDSQIFGPPESRSAALFGEAQHLIPGGVNSPVRAFTAVGGIPRFIVGGKGAYVRDADGNQYLDFLMSWGPLIHGHAFGPVVEAIRQAAGSGTSFGAPTPAEVTLAKLVVESVPSIEMVRFVSSGTEAAMSGIRLARASTGRDVIVKFAGNYHGHADALLAQAGSGSLTFGVPTSPGVPASAVEMTVVIPYNDLPALRATFAERGREIAAVIVEPIAGNMGVVLPIPDFLAEIRRLSSDHGAIFICDEVITGFRVSAGGAQALFGIEPDLTILGKIIGGGLPAAAYGGRRRIMELMAPTGPVYQAGTLSGNPLAMAAGIANLAPLRDPALYRRLSELTEQLAHGLRDAASLARIPVWVNACTGMLTLFFAPGPVSTLRDAQSADTARYAHFFRSMLEQGIYLPPSQFEAWMLSGAHDDAMVDRTVQAAAAAFQRLA